MRYEVRTNTKKPAYPGLFRGENTGVIILMTYNCEGTVVGYINPDPNDPTVQRNPIGKYRDNWMPSSLKPFDGQVTLKSE